MFGIPYINKLESVQGFAARLATGRWSEQSEPIRKELGWPSLVDQRKVTEALPLQADPVGRFLHPSHLLPAPPVSPSASCKLQTTLQKGGEDQLLQTIFFRASVECHPRGDSGSGSGLSFQKATQTTFLLTLFVYFILLCVAMSSVCVCPFFLLSLHP